MRTKLVNEPANPPSGSSSGAADDDDSLPGRAASLVASLVARPIASSTVSIPLRPAASRSESSLLGARPKPCHPAASTVAVVDLVEPQQWQQSRERRSRSPRARPLHAPLTSSDETLV